MKKLLAIFLTIAVFVSVLSPAARAENLVTVYVETPQYTANGNQTANFSAAVTALNTAFEKRKSSVDLTFYRIPKDSITSLYLQTLFGNPQYFYVDTAFSYNYSPLTEIVSMVNISYTDTADIISTKIYALTAKVDAVLSGMENSMSDLDKVLYFHDYLANTIDYDYENYLNGTLPDTVYTAYGALVDNIAVCQGYSLAFTLLCNKVGIESSMIISDSMNHAWNGVKLSGVWYYLDITHDDSIRESNDNYIFRSGVHHNRFLLSDSELSAAGYADWYNISVSGEVISAPSGFGGGYIWEGVLSPMFYHNGLWYYEDGGMIYASKIDGTDKRLLLDKSSAFGSYSQLAFDGERFYYNSGNKIFSIHLRYADESYLTESNSDAYTKTLVSVSGGTIAGMNYKNGRIEYELVDAQGNYLLNFYSLKDVTASDLVDIKIELISDVTDIFQKPDVISAREAYNVLTSSQKDLVLDYPSLNRAEAMIRYLEQGVLSGDVDRDGIVTVSDVVALRQMIMLGTGAKNLEVADLNNDFVVTVSDVVALRTLIMSGAVNAIR